MGDAEVLALLLVGQWRGSSERALLRWADAQLRSWFPVVLSQSAFNRRVHRLGPVLTRLLVWLADQLGATETPYQLADTTPVPLARQCRGERHRLFAAEASIGRGGVDRGWYYGCKVLLLLAAEGPITGFVLAQPQQDRWPLEASLQGAPIASRLARGGDGGMGIAHRGRNPTATSGGPHPVAHVASCPPTEGRAYKIRISPARKALQPNSLAAPARPNPAPAASAPAPG